MPECRTCGAEVSTKYVRVFSQDGESVDCCPRCPDMVRRDGKPTPAKSARHGGHNKQDRGDHRDRPGGSV